MKTRLTEQTDILKKVLIHLNFCEMSHASTKHLKLTNPRFEFDWFSLKKWHPVMLVRFFFASGNMHPAAHDTDTGLFRRINPF